MYDGSAPNGWMSPNPETQDFRLGVTPRHVLDHRALLRALKGFVTLANFTGLYCLPREGPVRFQ